MVALPYGRAPYRLDLAGRAYTLLELPSPGAAPPTKPLIEAALDQPIGSLPVERLVSRGDRVTVILSDATRDEPRATFLEALRARLPEVRWTIAIATGTHGPAGVTSLGLPEHVLADARLVDHDGHCDDQLVELGTTRHGTVARVHRCVVDADLVIATGCIRPHYFAGFGAGVKAIFPGLGAARDVRHNHTLKQHPRSRAGIVDGNPCRADLEEAVAFLPTPSFLVNGVCASDGAIHAAVAGELVTAFRAGVELARPWFTATAAPADLVIASDALPVTASIYQAAKIAAAVAPLVREGGTLLVVAECANGLSRSTRFDENADLRSAEGSALTAGDPASIGSRGAQTDGDDRSSEGSCGAQDGGSSECNAPTGHGSPSDVLRRGAPGKHGRSSEVSRSALTVVNEAILRIGVLPRLAKGVRLCLVSSLPDDLVHETLFEPVASVNAAMNGIRGSILVIPRASQLLLQ